jgi:hypothetical protein
VAEADGPVLAQKRYKDIGIIIDMHLDMILVFYITLGTGKKLYKFGNDMDNHEILSRLVIDA